MRQIELSSHTNTDLAHHTRQFTTAAKNYRPVPSWKIVPGVGMYLTCRPVENEKEVQGEKYTYRRPCLVAKVLFDVLL